VNVYRLTRCSIPVGVRATKARVRARRAVPDQAATLVPEDRRGVRAAVRRGGALALFRSGTAKAMSGKLHTGHPVFVGRFCIATASVGLASFLAFENFPTLGSLAARSVLTAHARGGFPSPHCFEDTAVLIEVEREVPSRCSSAPYAGWTRSDALKGEDAHLGLRHRDPPNRLVRVDVAAVVFDRELVAPLLEEFLRGSKKLIRLA
jgi:hypothetical protein